MAEIDCLRGIAILLMIAYHVAFDLNYLGIQAMPLDQTPLMLLQRITVFIFVFVAGIALSLSYSRSAALPFYALLKKQLKRTAFLGTVAAAITIATLICPGDGFIAFGIIHFLAVATILSLAFKNLSPKTQFALAAIIAVTGLAANQTIVQTPFLFWLGLPFPSFHSLDYFPILPWFSIILVGMATGTLLYPHRQPRFALPSCAITAAPAAFLQLLGRNSLVIYLAHQPIIIGLLLVATTPFL